MKYWVEHFNKFSYVVSSRNGQSSAEPWNIYLIYLTTEMSILFKLTSFVNSSFIKPSWRWGYADWNGTNEYRRFGPCIPNWYFDFLNPSNIWRIIRNRRVPIELSFISSCVEVLRCVNEFPAWVTKIFLESNGEHFCRKKCSAFDLLSSLGNVKWSQDMNQSLNKPVQRRMFIYELTYISKY